MNYLPAATKQGANIFCNIEVSYIEQASTATRSVDKDTGTGTGTSEALWIVHCVTTDPDIKPPQEITIKCATLVLAAGTLGTTEILLRSRERGMQMSGQVRLLHLGLPLQMRGW